MSQQRKERRQVEEPPEKDPGFLRKVIIGVVIAVALGATYYVGYHRRVHEHDNFARCLKQHDVKMYGAYWCPHCAEQKALFQASFEYVPHSGRHFENPAGLFRRRDKTLSHLAISSHGRARRRSDPAG